MWLWLPWLLVLGSVAALGLLVRLAHTSRRRRP